MTRLIKDPMLDNYGCVMLGVDLNLKFFSDVIDNDDLYTDGRYTGKVTLPHVSLLYGLTDDNLQSSIIDCVIGFESDVDDIIINKIDYFKNNEYDVIKFNIIKTEQLVRMNNRLKSRFNYFNNYPDYEPHITIAYVKSGMGEAYCKLLNKYFNRLYISNMVKVSELVISDIKGLEHIYDITKL